MFQSQKQQRIGEAFIVSQLALSGIFPIVTSYATRLMPPVLFAGLSALAAAACLIPYLFFTKHIKKIADKKSLLLMLGVTLFIIIIPSLFIYIGASKTSSINSAILLQTELFFTFLICGIFFDDTISLQKIIGAATILIGAAAVLYNGSFKFNWGDIFIIAGTVFYPIGNICAKKVLRLNTPPSLILFVRNAVGGFALVLISFLFEKYEMAPAAYIKPNLYLILINGIVVFFMSKVLWYEGLKRIEITEATSISISRPAFSLLYALVFLGEIPTGYQIAGLAIIITGLVILMRHKHKIEVEPVQ